MTAVPYKVGDTWPPLTGTVTNDGVGVDLTPAATVTLHLTRPDDTVVSRVVTRSNQSTDPGEWTWQLEAGDLSLRGEYLVELQVDWDGTRSQSFPQDGYQRLYVLDQLA